MEILHPRPSAIAAAMYTLRDLGADAIVLHGPPGCNFRTSRILEEDGVRVFTTAMLEYDFIFGGKEKLIEVLKKIDKMFSFKLIGVVGTCASMIIGEDISSAIDSAGLKADVIVVETHAGFGDNTQGAIQTLRAALERGVIDEVEFERQKTVLERATEIEKKSGMASMEYIPPSRGDDKEEVAREIRGWMEEGEGIFVILNAKKELGYIFSDILLAINEIGRKYGSEIINIANLDPEIGLPRVRRYSQNILRDLREKGVKIHHISGGIDEYSSAGEKAVEIAENYDIKRAVIIGNPHAVPLEIERRIGVTNGPREVEPLKRMGFNRVVVELDAHSLVVGVDEIVRSEFGEILRKIGGCEEGIFV
ncbi:MAG: Ni-sirohydrochlorin a,c-diamide reductive cyclase catalytic subunit [Candidatus Syntropharchaeia archaeon]